MKIIILSLMSLATGFLWWGFPTGTPAQAFESEPLVIQSTGEGFALVELFTSQGCSSCPPADRLLQDLLADAGDKEVYALSFHVDYWNYLGWKDPYSAAAYSDRQRTYAKKFHSTRVYTPQMIVNGTQEFIGSDRTKAALALAKALAKASNTFLELKWYPQSQRLRYEVKGITEPSLLRIALVEKKAENSVPRGENRGKRLSHAQVVQKYESVNLEKDAAGDLTFEIPEDLDRSQLEIVVYVQNQDSWMITGANKLQLRTD
ncbi:MAG: DUF1223 domain-containing protein [Bacteroidia bacterium]